MKTVYSFDGYAPRMVKETPKAILFEFPAGKLTPGGGRVGTRPVWVPKSIIVELQTYENNDSDEFIIIAELPAWFENEKNI